ncbi:MAG: type 4a pilus biogenesis protein PilO [Rubricoccaceae bacterium]|nr:type 4a pilus biogenesis protein PilO [Rubricoccaceae bacterium]
MSARNIFGSFVIALALFSFWPFVVGRYQEVGAMRAGLAEREALVDRRQSALENIAAEYEQLQSRLTGTDRDKFENIVPSGVDAATIVSSIDSIAAGTGMQLVEVSVSENRTERGARTQSVAITMELEGRYESFTSFLAQLERNVRLMDVQSLEVGVTQQSSTILTYSVNANAYFIR